MRMLCIYPGMDERINDNIHVLLYLKQHGIELAVICSRSIGLKSKEVLPVFENIQGIPIYRIYENFSEQSAFFVKKYDQALNIAQQFKPDIIFCSHQFNMSIAERLQGNFRIPIVLFVEFARKPERLYRRRFYIGWKPLANIVGNIHWMSMAKKAEVIITSYQDDMKFASSLSRYGTRIYYVPWCNHIPVEINRNEIQARAKRGIYVGSFVKWKNVGEFALTIPLILEKTPIKEFVFIGPSYNVDVIRVLRKKFGKRVDYQETVPRIVALKMMQESFFAYTPVKFGGWGFIGDSWGVKTPLVATHNDYGLKDNIDTIIVRDITRIHEEINRLYANPHQYVTLQEGGFTRYMEYHSVVSVGKKLINILESL